MSYWESGKITKNKGGKRVFKLVTGKAVNLGDEKGRKYHAQFTSRAARDILILKKGKELNKKA